MTLISRLLRSFFILIALLLTCISLSADWLFERGGLANWFEDCATLLESQRKSEQLTRETQTTVKRLFIKARIAEALRDGEMTLLDAAVIFRTLHEDPKSWHHPQRPRPALQDGEGWCREVIWWTQRYIFFDHSSSHAQALRQRLEAELHEQMEEHGGATLPK